MRAACIAVVLAATVLAGTASASTALTAPTGLHGFLLRADEPAASAFHRTPSFAWAPSPGAIGYQFQISTSSTFRDNGIIYNSSALTTPVAAPALLLPWITGSPHALYARVRATVSTGAGTDVTPWSGGYGFDVTPPPPPTPLPSEPGLLRWTPIEGADSYQVWLVDARTTAVPTGKKETVRTNVLDERDFYTFHQSTSWTSSIHWRIRAIRSSATAHPANGLPAVSYGAWSPVYNSTNPAVTGGPIKLIHSVSDVTSDGSATSAAHRLMPAFTWTGNQSLTGIPAELYRVYVFTDSQCLNLVYTSAVVGSPAYAPRPRGPLALPSDPAGIAVARGTYLDDGAEADGEMIDGTTVATQESAPPATPTSVAPVDAVPPGPAAQPITAAPSSGVAPAVTDAPVDLWDTDWPDSGYYWTVIPVSALVSGGGASTVSGQGASKGSNLVAVADTTQFSVGDTITIGSGINSDTGTITALGNGLLTLKNPLNSGHASGEPISTTGSSAVVYQDLELPQDACASGRIQRFGISSEPSLTTAQDPFATGLSQTGRLTSAAETPAFYGQPLVAWTPALGAQNYQVQWSQKAPGATSSYPFKSAGTIMTTSTSAILPLTPGTWYYRVRGFDYDLPTGVQQMAWSDPQQLVVTKPTFKVGPVKKNKFKVVKP
jgi:hypothetical protein